MRVAGIGCRKGVAVGEVLAAVEACRALLPSPLRGGGGAGGGGRTTGLEDDGPGGRDCLTLSPPVASTPTPHPSPQGGGETDMPPLDALATAAFKAGEPGIVAAAEALGLSLIPVPHDDLKRASAGCLTFSEASLATTGVASVSEAAALAAAGEGSQLLGPRIATGNVTCAIAQGKDQA